MSLQESSLCDAAVFLQENNATEITEVSESALSFVLFIYGVLEQFGHYDKCVHKKSQI